MVTYKTTFAGIFIIIVGLGLYADVIYYNYLDTDLQHSSETYLTLLREFKSEDYRRERNVFRRMLNRTSSTIDICKGIPQTPKHEQVSIENKYHLGVKPLPEHGLHEALEKWLSDSDKTNNDQKNAGSERDYPTCSIPPPKMCNTTKVSVILMSHTVAEKKRVNKMLTGIWNLSKRPETGEIILVWNSEKELLTNSTMEQAHQLLGWASDPSFPLRIFFALENGMENNLLNRYHPKIKPRHETIMYFDDDGPFFNAESMQVALKLWEFNSDTQVGGMSRNLRFTSERMNSMQKQTTDSILKLLETDAWQIHISPNDQKTISSKLQQGENDDGYPKFTPICQSQTGDRVEYNYNLFPNFQAHMFLPSGTLLHRNYLCFIWHPVFEELRQFILQHPTHPDDMFVSTLISHLSGKFLRSYPRNTKKATQKRRRLQDVVDSRRNDNVRRRLLWEQKDWGNMREEAINSLVNYFGSINPGSVGWCAGTKYQIPGKSGEQYQCDPQFPTLDQVPWMNKGIGYSECHDD